MPTPFIGEVRIFAGNFAPSGWALCNGQLLPILGTTYGGNGVSTFGLPDLRGRAPLQPGQGPGLPEYDQGEVGGVETVTLTSAEIPVHTHTVSGNSGNGVADSPQGRVAASNPAGIPQYATIANTDLAASAAGPAGGSQPHNNMQPYLAVNYIIALTGIFPPRS